MSLSQRLHNQNDSKQSDHLKEFQKYEAEIRQLKTLSKSQTAFLKAYLHGKLSAGANLVAKAVDYLGKTSEDAKARELKNALTALKLHEIEVDVTSAQIMLHEELSILRGAIENGGDTNLPKPPALPGQQTNTADTDRIKAIETENSKLRDLLKEAQLELSNAKPVPPPAPVVSAGNNGAKDEEVRALRRDLEDRTKECETLRRDLEAQREQLKSSSSLAGDKDRSLSALQAKVDQLTRDLGDDSRERALQAELKQAKEGLARLEAQLAQSAKDAASQLSAQAKELTATADRRVAEAEARLEAEKDEMMEAMAQEVDEIERTKAAEKEALVAERDRWHQKYTALQRTNYVLVFGFKRLTEASRALARDHAAHAQATKRALQEVGQNMRSTCSDTLLRKLKGVNDEIQATEMKYRREMAERKKLHNLVQELKGNIRVYMRCRPPTTKELEQFGNDAQCVSFPGAGEVKVFNEKNREKSWEFDEVFDTSSRQADVYADVSALVTSVMDGFNVCIFAYGQTGSGKTWTMSGPPDNRGVNTRALEELFTRARDRSREWRDVITVSLLEVYNEEIRDLLAEGGGGDGAKLEVKMGEFGNHVPGLTSVPVDGIDMVFNLLATADRNRSSTATNMNEHSSRSHMMMTVTVVSEFLPTGATSRGKLNLVDLAGSERINKSGAVGQALKEAQNINKSLSALGDVIAARAQKTAHVPFRNSTLTFLLQDSLSQDSKTLMIVCVSPVLYNAEETFCSLNFASRVRTVELGKASKNTVTGGAASANTSSKSSASGGAGAVGGKTRQSTSGLPSGR